MSVLRRFLDNRKYVALASGGLFTGTCILKSMTQIPPDHVGIVQRLDGSLRPDVFHSSEIALIVPFWERLILLREKPVQKRFIREFRCSDDKSIEARLTVTLQSPVHWMPEIFYKFGRDFGRTFLEREAVIDFEEVCKKFPRASLLADESPQRDQAVAELNERISDAAAFHKLKVVDSYISFVDPELDLDQY